MAKFLTVGVKGGRRGRWVLAFASSTVGLMLLATSLVAAPEPAAGVPAQTAASSTTTTTTTAGSTTTNPSYKPTLERTPDHGPAGTLVSFSGSNCRLWRTADRAHITLGTSSGTRGVAVDVPVAPDATFSGTIRVPVDGPPGEWIMLASCAIEDQVGDIAVQPFTVDPGPPLTVTPPPTSSSVPPRPTLPAARPARAVAARPHFTG